MKTKALRSMNLDSTWVGTRSTRVPNFRVERWGHGGTRPYRIQEVNAQNLFRGILMLTATLACVASIGLAAEISLESAPPVVVKTVPAAGATDVDPGLAEIKVTYSKAMQDGSWSWCTWEHKEDYPETTGNPKYLQDGRTCVLPVKLQPNKFYALWLNTEKFKNFKDTSRRPAVPYLLTFFTGDAVSSAKQSVAMSEIVEKAYVYHVAAGDTLSAIADTYRAKGIQVTVDAIVKANPGLNTRALKVGQKIFIPVATSSASASSSMEAIAEAVRTISQCAEGDPRVEQALSQLRALPEREVVSSLVPFLDWSKNTLRRSAVYVLQNGGFADITPAVASLQKLLAHQEDLTRGMTALALGQNHVRESFDALAKMTKADSSGYARRCAAYALGLLGDPRAELVLKAALDDREAFVRNNAKAALAMLKAGKTPPAGANGKPRKFVKLVVDKDQMTFEGKPVTREQLEDRLAEVPDRAHTVLELAVTADGPPAMEFLETKNLASILVRRLGFEYLSLVGVHPLGSKGEPAKPPPANRKFVKLVVGKGKMTFEGAPITRDQLETRLAEVPDRPHTVLELASTSDGSTADGPSTKDLFEMEKLAGQLAAKLGFEYLSLVGVHPLGSKGGQATVEATSATVSSNGDALLNDDQRAVLEWTDRQFRSFFDDRTFDGWSEEERGTLERKLIDSLKGPRTTEYYQAINTLAALRSTKALPALREIAYDRREKDNRDRWMAIRALGMIGEQSDVPELIPLLYHGNSNTRWWAQISLVRLTGQNFGKDWNAWGKWWNDDQNGKPPYKPEIIRWWSGQPEPEKLADSLAESDTKFLNSLKPKAAATESTPGVPVSAGENDLKSLVEDFFRHNYRDITSRETLEWGEVKTDAKGNASIRYKYRAKIWDKNTITNNEEFTFDPKGKLVSVKQIYADPKDRMMRLVEKFFGENYRDITSRETLEWGEVVPAENGNTSIRYKYRAKIWDKDTITNDQVFTFDPQDKYVSAKKVSPGAP